MLAPSESGSALAFEYFLLQPGWACSSDILVSFRFWMLLGRCPVVTGAGMLIMRHPLKRPSAVPYHLMTVGHNGASAKFLTCAHGCMSYPLNHRGLISWVVIYISWPASLWLSDQKKNFSIIRDSNSRWCFLWLIHVSHLHASHWQLLG